MGIITCVDCGNEVSNAALSCPNCGRPSGNKSVGALLAIGIILAPYIFSWFTLRKGHSIFSRIISFAWLILIVWPFIETGNLLTTVSSSGQGKSRLLQMVESGSLPKSQQISMVSISTILSDYEDNEIGADNKYKGRYIQTTGIIDSVKKDLMGSLYVTLGTGSQFEFPKIQAFFDKSERNNLALLRKGSSLTVTCQVEGLMMNVLVKKCQIN
jgi:hypothetical protein